MLTPHLFPPRPSKISWKKGLTSTPHSAIIHPMEATDKHPALDALFSSLSGGKNRQDIIAQGLCMTCDRTTTALFRDEVSRDEYRISGMCQSCQDSVFGADEPEQEPYK